MNARLVRKLFAVLLLGGSICAQGELAAGSCPTNVSFEREGYTVRKVRVVNPFSFLRFVKSRATEAEAAVSNLQGQPYIAKQIRDAADKIWDSQFLPDESDFPVKASGIVTYVENCSDKNLDVVYFIFSSQMLARPSLTFESKKATEDSPQKVAGAEAGTRFKLAPSVGYERARRGFAGGSASLNLRNSALQKFAVSGTGSPNSHEVSAEIAGSRDNMKGKIRKAEWGVSFANSSMPLGAASLSEGILGGHFMANTAPIGSAGVVFRFGGVLQGGPQQTGFTSGLATNTVANAGTGAMRVFAGATTSSPMHNFSGSYGLEIGSSNHASSVDWFKHVVDVAHSSTWKIGDHRFVEVEDRFSGGWLNVVGMVPAASRFFAGNRESNFVPTADWTFRDVPVIRSIPTNRLFQTADGVGGTSFLAGNITASVTAWRFPLVPSEITSDTGFQMGIASGMSTAQASLEAEYLAEEPKFLAAAKCIPELVASLQKLKQTVATIATGAGATHPQELKGCQRSVSTAERRASGAQDEAGIAQYGYINDLVANPDQLLLQKVREACAGTLNSLIHDAQLSTDSDAVDNVRKSMLTEFQQIDNSMAKQKAEAELRDARRIIKTITEDVNLLAISPVVVFDVVHLGPANGDVGTRYAVGGGVRLSLVSHVDFTLGYAASPKRLSGEPPGALFFEMKLKNLFE